MCRECHKPTSTNLLPEGVASQREVGGREEA